jgi:predicted permease
MKRDDDLNREIEAHIEMEAEELRAEGLSTDDARVRAKRTFGSAALAAERTREVWPFVWMENLTKSAQLALRRAAHAPGFTATVTLVIALAVGVSTALFSFADVVFFKPLPYPAPERLFAASVQFQSSAGRVFETCCTGADWEALTTHATKFERAVYSGGVASVNLATGDRAILVKQHRVGRDFFATLGMAPVMGRSFNAAEDTTNGPAAVVISDGLRRKLFGDARNPVGEKILLKGEPFEVVGVAAPNFYAGVRADLWTPLRPDKKGEGMGSNYAMMIRLKPGVTQAEALSELENLSREIPRRPPNREGETFSQRFVIRPLLEGRTEGIRTPMLVLLGAVGIVLLIGAVNVGGLLLARQSGRAAELATRMALGASSRQIFTEVLLDSLVLISLGGLLALPTAWLALEGLKALTSEMTSLGDSAAIDARCLLVAAVMTLAAGLIAGLFPAWQATRTQPRGGSARGVSGRSRKIPLGSLVMAQVALFVPLLIGAGLLGRSFLSLWNANPGFDPANISVARFSLQENRYADRDKVDRLLREGIARMAQIPGVESAAAGLHMPLERWLNMQVRFNTKEPGRTGNMNYVTPNYFTALRIPILRGRNFNDGDNATGEKVVIVNDALVKMFLEGRDPLNEAILLRDGKPYRIVGVVGDTQQRGGWGSYGPLHPMPAFYITAAQGDGEFFKLVHQWFSPAWIVRSRLDQATLARQLETVIRGIDPMLPIASFSTPTEIKSQTLGMQLLTFTLISAISGLGLLLCVLGVYGLVSSGVTERTREIGIRLALGATRAGVVSAAMRPGLLWAAAGIAIGAPLAYLGREAVVKLLYKVEVTDPAALGVIAVVLLLAVGVASLLPALRLARLDPAVTLRDE